ncbi:MAG TPA: type II toxin-antitoxin system RelE/ParE family toxin [Bradyrhizobium sp.]
MKLRYTPRGAAELDQVLGYIETRSPQGALHVKRRIQVIMDLLLRHPHAGQLTSKNRLRRMVVSPYPYVVFYHATEDEIVIHGVRHSARNPLTAPE